MRIDRLFIYPVKSMRGVSLSHAHVGALGLENDRRWMVVDDSGKFITQRDFPALACIEPEVISGGLILKNDNDAIEVKAPDTKVMPVKIWKDDIEAYLADVAANVWLSRALGTSCRLVYQGDKPRQASQKWAQPGDMTSFADGYPVLLTSTASLADIERRACVTIPMNRFRPNIVIGADVPWDEDAWKHVRIGDVMLDIVKPCARCVVITADQQTGQRMGREPLYTLTRFRMLKTERQTGVIFGQNAIARTYGVVRVGDAVSISNRQAPPEFVAERA